MVLNPVIEVRGVWKSFKTVQAVKGIDLKIPRGQFVAILGPNGAGKTTLMRILTGYIPASHGQAFIGDYEIHESPKDLLKNLLLIYP